MPPEVATAIAAVLVAALALAGNMYTARKVNANTVKTHENAALAKENSDRVTLVEDRLSTCEQRCEAYRLAKIEAAQYADQLERDLENCERSRNRLMDDLRKAEGK